MKRTQSQRQVKNASSAAPENISASENDDSSKKRKIPTMEIKSKLSFENLFAHPINRKNGESKVPRTKKLRATVDLEMMREELKQLEDPPVTKEEKEISSKKLPFSFFDVPCIDLAKKLLGKILVRRLENGTILRGRIVETEAYLGVIDKASQTHEGKVTPRNLPMYMSPGTIYVYMTYGMYHCFNISSAESNSHVLISALEVLSETDYVELLRNTESKIGKTEKSMIDDVKTIDPRELCNEPWKICPAFGIDIDDFNLKEIWNSNVLWLEKDSTGGTIFIVDAPIVQNLPDVKRSGKNFLRYYVVGSPCVVNRKGCAVLLRGLEPIEGIDEMRRHRVERLKSRKDSRQGSKRTLANHEICNGPSKLCIALKIERNHCKYSLCDYKSMWIENDEYLDYPRVVESRRIGIDSAGPEWANKHLRYYIYGNTSVSKRDKKAESQFTSGE